MTDNVLLSVAGGIATVTLNRPERHNVFDDALIAELTALFTRVGEDPAVRAVVLESTGRSFSAGADLGWMKRMAGNDHDANLRDAEALGALMKTIDRCPKPVIGVVQGACYGGGVGLVACCDIAVASDAATFSLSEVKLGILPAVISPYVVAAMGERACRRYFLTAERFSAAEAHRLGLLHEVVPADELHAARDRIIEALWQCGPAAQAAAKDLIFAVARKPTDAAVIRDTAERIAAIRASDEGREGLSAFLEKRKPRWLSAAEE
ncbi:enoyl-CoA hydratase/isomerase family protein [Azospirillum sp.]|uniref:enoyl-CoA hydratase/isomerase family protein n=1 Tax=Azospirillum sp. TaxID=34012 RepID=UPI002D554F23|nr:enoyl-CoA hydratase/isomerase family protein [Azospirillum sp.]HYD64712.1 enoyl-CoA hydratase/isomerase family protein [Azospirillum sp.]